MSIKIVEILQSIIVGLKLNKMVCKRMNSSKGKRKIISKIEI